MCKQAGRPILALEQINVRGNLSVHVPVNTESIQKQQGVDPATDSKAPQGAFYSINIVWDCSFKSCWWSQCVI
jgi:hypothetical protein